MSTMTKETRTAADLTPALTEAEWARYDREGLAPSRLLRVNPDDPADTCRHIAVLNSLLPATDRRKLNWDYIDRMRQIGQRLSDSAGVQSVVSAKQFEDIVDGAALIAIAAVLASYLSPREDTESSNG